MRARTRQNARSLFLPLAALLAALLAATCDNDSGAPTMTVDRPGKLQYVSGNNQVGRRLARLGQPLTVQVLDGEGRPVPAFTVRFRVTSFSGNLAGGERELATVTNSSGLTAVYLVLGGALDSSYTVEAIATGPDSRALQGSPVTFTAAASAAGGGDPIPGDTSSARPANILAVSSPGQDTVGYTGERLTDPRVVQVLDTAGKPIAGVSVVWTVIEGGGTVGAAIGGTTLTDNNGLATAYWTMGPQAGTNRLQAHFIDPDGILHKLTFTVRALSRDPAAAQPDSLAVMAGLDQQAEVGAILPLPVTVAVFDNSGHRVPNAGVTFTITRGGGSLAPEGQDPSPSKVVLLTVTTNAEGLAVVTWQLGPGPDLDNDLTAEVRLPDGTVRHVAVHAEARPARDTASRLVVMSGNFQGDGGQYAVASALPLPLVVRVVDTLRRGSGTDTLGAPIANFPVLFESLSPGGDAGLTDEPGLEPGGTGRLQARTDQDGLAAVRLTLSTRTGGPDDLNLIRHNNLVVAVAVFADGSQDSVLFYATGVPGAASSIAPTGSQELTGIAGRPLSGLGVFASDAHGNPVAGVAVSYLIGQTPGGGTIAAPARVTDINGLAAVAIDQLSTKAGTMEIAAANGQLEGSPVTYTIQVLPDAPAEFLLAGGDSQSSAAGTAFKNPLKVLVFDQYRNPVPGALVSFRVTAGSVALSELSLLTGADGSAATTATPNAEGAITVEATTTIGGATRTVSFSLTATAAE